MMKKKRLFLLVGLSTLFLSACTYYPFNEFTGIDFAFSTDKFNVVQHSSSLFWDYNEKCMGYDIYLYENQTSSSKSSSKSNSSSSTIEKPIASTSDCSYSIPNSWVGNKIKIVGYTYDLEKNTNFTFEKKTVFQSSKILIEALEKPTFNHGQEFTIDNDYLKTTFKNDSYGTIKIPKSVSKLYINDISSSYYAKFAFEERENDNNIIIILRNSSIVGKSVSDTKPTFYYEGNRSNCGFYFSLYGTNSISAMKHNHDYSQADCAVDLPNIVFDSADSEGTLTIYGGAGYSEQEKGGYAIKSNRIINYLEPSKIKLVGGKGGDANESNEKGGAGQIPIDPSTAVYSKQSKSIGLKAGNGGSGGTFAKGGDAYSYNYYVDRYYYKYKCSFYCIEEANTGSGGKGNGTLITK